MIREQNSLIEGLQAQVESKWKRNKTLTDKCAEHLKEVKMFKVKLGSVVDAIKEKDCQLKTLEKEKADILLM